MTTELTPFDTGARCEPKPWMEYGTPVSEQHPAEDFGKVDFDDDEGRTVAVAWVERQDDGTHRMRVQPLVEDAEFDVVVDWDAPSAVSPEEIQELIAIIDAYRHALRAQHSVDDEVLQDYDKAHGIASRLSRPTTPGGPR